MNAQLFQRLRLLANEEGIDRFFEPDLPPLDMAADALDGIGQSLGGLGRALGLDVAVQVCDPLFPEARTTAQIEMQLLNTQFALMRSMLLLGYDWTRLEAAMLRMIESGAMTLTQPPKTATA